MRSVDFLNLIEPVGLEQFLGEFWEREPLIVRGDGDRYRGLLCLDDLEMVIAAVRDRPGCRGAYAVRAEDDVITEYLLKTASSTRSFAAARSAFDDGYTLVVNGVAAVHRPISLLCATVETHLQHPVGANLYCTPPAAQGFLPHFDFQDTFFLQLEGVKQWSLWEPTVKLPRREEPLVACSPPARPPDRQVVLGAGDLLYLPRGWIHAGATSEQLSLHLTVGVAVASWADLLIEHVRCWARNDVALRHSLPLAPRLDPGDGWFAETLRSLVDRMAGQLDGTSALVELLGGRLSEREQSLEPRLRTSIGRRRVSLDTVVERRDGLAPLVTTSADGCQIRFQGSDVNGPPEAEKAFRFVASSSGFTVADIPDLPDDARCDLVQQLVLQGLLRPVPEAS